jgi:response regulator RpfG family c-di-GMP phosphodiesterase
MNTHAKIKVLYVDDEKSNLIAFKANYREEFEIHIAEGPEQGMDVLVKEKINVIITDQRMPHITGVEFLESIMHSHPFPVRILLTGYTDMETIIEAVNKGKIFQYINKPYDIEKLREVIINAFGEYERIQKILRDNQQYEFILRQKLLQ